MGEAGYSWEATVAMFLFSCASSSLLLINKLCLHYMPLPSFVSTLQFFVASSTCLVLMGAKVVPSEKHEWKKVKPYMIYVSMFVATIFCNMKALQQSNVETIIVFRACCPLIVCVLDWAFMGHELPSLRSGAALLVLLGGALGYVATDRAFTMQGYSAYSWVTAYFLIISVEMVFGKHIVGPHLGFASMWGPTLYTNTISFLPMLTIGLVSGEPAKLAAVAWSAPAVGLLATSCVVGVAISYLGWKARSLVTATCYTVLGVANKMVTVLTNSLIWDQHASPLGMACLAVCLLGAVGYKQAPLRQEDEEGAVPLQPGGEAPKASGFTRAKPAAALALAVGALALCTRGAYVVGYNDAVANANAVAPAVERQSAHIVGPPRCSGPLCRRVHGSGNESRAGQVHGRVHGSGNESRAGQVHGRKVHSGKERGHEHGNKEGAKASKHLAKLASKEGAAEGAAAGKAAKEHGNKEGAKASKHLAKLVSKEGAAEGAAAGKAAKKEAKRLGSEPPEKIHAKKLLVP